MTPADELNAIAALAEIPEGAVLTDAVLITAYHDQDGAPMVGVATFGDATVTHRLGMLAYAQQTVWHLIDDEDDDEEDNPL